MREKGKRRIDKEVNGEHEIRQYGRKLVRRVHYKLKPISEEDLKFLKEIFPDYLDSKPFKRLIPHASVEGDHLVYECPERPKVYFDVRKGTIKVPTKDYEEFKKVTSNNQAHFAVHQVKDCAEYFEISWIEMRYLPRRLRHGRTADDFNIWAEQD